MRIKKIGLILFLVGIVYFLVFSPGGLGKIIQIRWQIRRTQQEMNILQAKEVALKYEINLLENDTSYIHRVAREKFGIKLKGNVDTPLPLKTLPSREVNYGMEE